MMYHPKCRKIEQLFSWQDDLLSVLDATPEKQKELRGRLWSMANLLNRKIKTKGE